jgi:GTP cyclohydrolase II
MQEGRGAGFAVKARDRMMVQASRHRLDTFEAYRRMGLRPDQRSYGEAAALAQLLGVSAPLVVLSSNPDKLAALGKVLEVAGTEPLAGEASPYNRPYLEAKIRFGHRLVAAVEEAVLAELPEVVEVFEPYALRGRPRFVHLATYLLPVLDAGGPHWFRLFAYFDLEAAAERVVLAYGPPHAPAPLVRIQKERLLERLSSPADRPERSRFSSCVERIVASGAGLIGLVPSSGFSDDLDERPGDPAAIVDLLAHHLEGRTARPLAGPEDESTPWIGEALRRSGVALGTPVALPRRAR